MVRDVVINGAVLRVSETLVSPDRPTLIFLHDSLGCIALWRDFPDALSKALNCNVLIYDRQGYGQSSPFTGAARDNGYMEAEADTLHLLIEERGIQQAILFGHSDGGSIALIAAAKYPARTLAVVTEGAHIFVEDVTLQGIRAAVTAWHTTNLRDRLRKYHGNKTDAVFSAWADTWLTNEYRSWNIEHFLPQIHCPVLIIQGEEDEYGTTHQVDKIVTQVSGPATKLIAPASGHTPHKEARNAVLAATLSFLRDLISGL